MGSHHGTVDTAPYDKDLLCRNCIRYLGFFKIAYSHAVQIHSSNAVIVRCVATVLTSKQVYLLITVSLFNVSADRATLACITGVNLNNSRLVLFSLVDKFLLDGFTAYETRLVLTIISSNNKVNTSVNANNITDIEDIAFLDIISNRNV